VPALANLLVTSWQSASKFSANNLQIIRSHVCHFLCPGQGAKSADLWLLKNELDTLRGPSSTSHIHTGFRGGHPRENHKKCLSKQGIQWSLWAARNLEICEVGRKSAIWRSVRKTANFSGPARFCKKTPQNPADSQIVLADLPMLGQLNEAQRDPNPFHQMLPYPSFIHLVALLRFRFSKLFTLLTKLSPTFFTKLGQN